MKKLIIAANLGRIRVLKYREAGLDPIDQEHLLEEPSESGKEHVLSVQEWVTDKAGRFSQGNAAGMEGGMSYGEEHELKEQIERNAMRRVATRIGEIVREEDHPIWVLAAPRSILPRSTRSGAWPWTATCSSTRRTSSRCASSTSPTRRSPSS